MALQIRAGEYRGQAGFKLSGKVKGYIFPVKIFTKSKSTASQIKELYLSGKSREEIQAAISKLLRSEETEHMAAYNHLRESLHLDERKSVLAALRDTANQRSQDLDRTLQRIRGMQQALDSGDGAAKRQYEKAYDRLIQIGDRVSKLGGQAVQRIKTGDPDALAEVDMISYYVEGWRFQRVKSMENKATRAARNKVRASIATASAVRSMISTIIGAVNAAIGPMPKPEGDTAKTSPYESRRRELGLTEMKISTMIKQDMPKGWKGDKLKYWRELHLLANEVQDIAFFATGEDENWEQAASRLGELLTRIKKMKALAEKVKKSGN